MQSLMPPPPCAPTEAVSEILHGVLVWDPYRWLEDQESARTRVWLAAQHQYARSYLDAIPARERIERRVRELLTPESHDSVLCAAARYFFRKRLREQEQPCIYFREGPTGSDHLLLDPAELGQGAFTAVRPLRASADGKLLLYEMKHGGERTGAFGILDVEHRTTLPDVIPRGLLRGFAFAPDGLSFFYVHEAVGAKRPHYRAAYRHFLGTNFEADQQIFYAGEDERLRLHIVPGQERLGFLVHRLLDPISTDFYVWPLEHQGALEPLIRGAEYKFGPVLLDHGRILALTDLDAANFRIIELRPQMEREPEFGDLIPATGARIEGWMVTQSRIFISYLHRTRMQIAIFDLQGHRVGQLPVGKNDSVRLIAGATDRDELFFECQSFAKPIQIYRYSARNQRPKLWANQQLPIDFRNYRHIQTSFSSRDGTRIPVFLVGHREVLESRPHPTIMTSYGGYGASMTPRFSVLVAFLIERGCLFALPNIRGGAEFGAAWHNAARRRTKQVAVDDFLSAAEWLIETGRTEQGKLAIFGGSHSGLLVGAAMTQRPDLFRAVVSIAPLLDMIRYHLFDGTHLWKDEFGTSDNPEDFAVLAGYSPYHQVRDGTAYPATLIVSGDADRTCNSLHARKMAARLQGATVSGQPVILDYRPLRGHSPVLPLSQRIAGLTDRLAFLCDQLGLEV